MKKELPFWQHDIACVLMVLPLLWNALFGGAYPPPDSYTRRFLIVIWLAMCAGLYVIWRKPTSIIGWVGFLLWGTLTVLFAVINVIHYTQDYLKSH